MTSLSIQQRPDWTSYQQYQISFIYAFSNTFDTPQAEHIPNFYKLPKFTPRELEEEIQKPESQLIYNIVCAALSNILNRNRLIESFKGTLLQLLTDKIKATDIDLETNPLVGENNFFTLSTEMKLYILYNLMEWQLQDSLSVKTLIDYNVNNKNNQYYDLNRIRYKPLGTDDKKRIYWQFGESGWIWREDKSKKPRHKNKVATVDNWELLCRTKEDIEDLTKSLKSSSTTDTNSSKKRRYFPNIDLAEEIETRGLDFMLEKEEKKRLAKERAELRKLMPVEVNITRTQLRSRGVRANRKSYNYDEKEIYGNITDDEDDQTYESENEAKIVIEEKPKTQPTRWSSRLHKYNSNSVASTDDKDKMITD
ncbi:hypothetical protein BDF20DRAFT_911973 [Mycotypha africana]|uniref:uncharacterized protein n=1 Tax=Mycotypha africana TaxID=64632 RepID=UPI00230032F6|nr:uncharacterized protein BDF20DRAFT_911973 [Mycotypha africana]KAI8981713.1 hypothetical protein BDF20DRAFT_911973 [Mycotypha africana]